MAGGVGQGGGSFLPSLENTWSGTAGKDLLFVPFVSLFLTFGMTLEELAVVGAPKHRAPRKHHQKLSRLSFQTQRDGIYTSF